MGVVPIHLGYYNRLRSEGFEAGDAFERMRDRFPEAPRPDEINDHRDVLADAFISERRGLRYMPSDPGRLAIARELTRQCAFVEGFEGQFVLTSEGRVSAKTFAETKMTTILDRIELMPNEIDDSMGSFLLRCCVIGVAAMMIAGALCALFFS